jgi:hypothetical protein
MGTGSKVERSTSLAIAPLRTAVTARGALVACALGAAACGAADEEGWQEFEVRQNNITGGTAVTGTDFNGGDKRRFLGTTNDCTATKIGEPSSTIVRFITAAHCIDVPPNNVAIINSNTGTFPSPAGPVYSVNQTFRHPSAPNPFLTGLQTSYDIAIVDVNDNAANGTLGSLPTELTAIGGIMLPGVAGFFIGYGCDDNNTTDGRKERGDIIVSAATSSENNVHQIYFHGATPRICKGDSGGPLFLQVGDRRVIAGINSGFNRNAGLEESLWPRVDNVFQWIDNPIAASDPSLLALNNYDLFLVNRASVLEFCLSYDNPVSGSDVRRRDCDSLGGIVSNKPSGWRLAASTVGTGFVLKSSGLNRCLGVAGASTAANAVVEVQPCAASTAPVAVRKSQTWTFSALPGDVETIKNVNSGRCLTATDSTKGSTLFQGATSCNASGVTGWRFYP